MASDIAVRQYIAHWFQLGKGVTTPDGQRWQPRQILFGDRYSPEFEACWQAILQDKTAYLQGTEQTIHDLRSDRWEMLPCSRCDMPIPLPVTGTSLPSACPCHDVPNWPHSQLPRPHSPQEVAAKTNQIRSRLASVAATKTTPPGQS